MVDIGRRKRGKEQSNFKTIPKERVLTKVDLAKHFMSWRVSLISQVKGRRSL